jgi:hypothetical protein
MNVRAVIPKCILKAKKSLSALYAGAGCSKKMNPPQRKQKRYTVPDVIENFA